MHTSRLAQLASIIAGISVVLFVGAPLLIQLDLMKSLQGFPVFLLGGLCGLLALLLGLVALYRTRPATGRAGRGRALAACLVGTAVVTVFAAAAVRSGAVPPINDITTDPDDPPQFVLLLTESANAGRDMSYPGESFASQQRAAYPDLAPIEVASPPDATHAAVVVAIQELGWKIVRSDPEAGAIEATDTSRIFRFVDDIAVRIRPTDSGSRVDVRSKSREGRGDIGANAARIRRLRDALQ